MAWDAILLQAELAPRPVRYFDTIDSTNNAAKIWLRSGAVAGSVVIADEQTKGRGRKGRVWLTPPGEALAVSYILYPEERYLSRVSMLAAIAVVEMLDQFGVRDVGIKWPNDAQIAGKKVCGILPEVIREEDRLLGVVLGIGINVKNKFENTPFAEQAISIETAINQSIKRKDLLVALLERLDFWSERLDWDLLAENWQRWLTTIGKEVAIPDADLSGIACSVDKDGALLIRTNTGDIQRVIAGDVMLCD